MLHYDGKKFRQDYLWGQTSQRQSEHTNWVTQPIPADSQWVIWWQFIRTTFLDACGKWIEKVNPACKFKAKELAELDNIYMYMYMYMYM